MDEKKKTPPPSFMADYCMRSFNDYLYYSDPSRFDNFNEADDMAERGGIPIAGF